jgi:hypothetical protein
VRVCEPRTNALKNNSSPTRAIVCFFFYSGHFRISPYFVYRTHVRDDCTLSVSDIHARYCARTSTAFVLRRTGWSKLLYCEAELLISGVHFPAASDAKRESHDYCTERENYGTLYGRCELDRTEPHRTAPKPNQNQRKNTNGSFHCCSLKSSFCFSIRLLWFRRLRERLVRSLRVFTGQPRFDSEAMLEHVRRTCIPTWLRAKLRYHGAYMQYGVVQQSSCIVRDFGSEGDVSRDRKSCNLQQGQAVMPSFQISYLSKHL